MNTGQRSKKDFTAIASSRPSTETIDYVEEIAERCAFVLPVFADDGSSDTYKNDVTSVFFGYPYTTTAVVLTLYKCDELKATLNNDTYGTFYAYGFQDDGLKKYIGFQLNWKLIMAAFGEGEYYVRATQTTIIGSSPTEDSFTWCLSQYYTAKADGTFLIEFYQNGIIGDYKIDTDSKSFKDLNWYNSIRLYGCVYGEKSEFQSEKIQYNNGNQIDFMQEQVPTYEVDILPIPSDLHRYIRVEALSADEIYLTDYNTLNPLRPFLSKGVLFRGNYEPEWRGVQKNAAVHIQFEQKINNLRKRIC